MKESKTKSVDCSFCGEVCTEENLVKLDGKKLCHECLVREALK